MNISSAECEVIQLIMRFGYMRTREVAMALFADASEQTARRALVQLTERGFLATERGPDGCNLFALTIRGARALRENGHAKALSTAFLLSKLGNYKHRSIANDYVLKNALKQDIPFFTEFEIQTGLAALPPLVLPVAKVPDFLVMHDGQVDWGEVEASKRATKDRQHLVRWFLAMFPSANCDLPHLFGGNYIRTVQFVCGEKFEIQFTGWVYNELINRNAEGPEQLAKDLVGTWCNFN